MVAHVEIARAEFKMAAEKLGLAIMRIYRKIFASFSAAMPGGFSCAIRCCRQNSTVYLVWNHTAMNPLLRRQAWQVPRKLDLKACVPPARLFVASMISSPWRPPAL